MSACPCCGFREGNGSPAEIAKTLRLGKTERAIFDALRKRFGSFMTVREIADAVYADRPDGGPEYADNCVAVAMFRVRKKLAGTGLAIDAIPGPGGGRRMIWGKTGRAAKK